MAYTILIAGKGGTGKTTFSGMMLRALAKKKKGSSILAVDADPSTNLSALFGVKPQDTVVNIAEGVVQKLDQMPAGMTKDRYIEYQVQNSLIELDGFDLMTMGRPEGPGCYCYANTVLRGLVEKMLSGYNYAVIDNEAGMEHLSRRTTRKAEVFFIITEPTGVSFCSAVDIFNLAKEMGIAFKKSALLINKSGGNAGEFIKSAKAAGIDIAREIPYDEELFRLSNQGRPISELSDGSLAMKAVEKLCEEAIDAI